MNLINQYFYLGEERAEIAKECLTIANGSSSKFVNNKIANVIVEDDGDHDIAILPGQVSNFRRIVGKCVKEFLHKDMVWNIFENLIL